MLAPTDPLFLACWDTGRETGKETVTHYEATGFPQGGSPQAVIPPVQLSAADKVLGGEEPAGTDLAELLHRLAGRFVVLASGRGEFLARFRRLCPGDGLPSVIDLEGMAAFLLPRRRDRSFSALCRRFLPDASPAEPGAADLRDLTAAFVRAHSAREPALRALFARCLDDIQTLCRENAEEAWDWLDCLRHRLDRPGRFQGGGPRSGGRLADGGFTWSLEEAPLDADRILRELEPRFAQEFALEFAGREPLPSRQEEPCGLSEEDRGILEAFFDLLPADFAPGAENPPERPGQRALAHAVETAFAENSFLLADAPTGTGKTLAYLAPLLLWSTSQNVRVALSTYTRALQEQAFFREIPRAIRLLRKAGLAEERIPRVSLLKGKANYICGRALVDSFPEAGEGSLAARIVWLRLALYYLEDPFGDLDGFSIQSGVPLSDERRRLRRARAMVNAVRGLPQCCFGKAARRCGAGIRTLRGERSHLVVTNHAFILSRPEWFSHIVFDECDHLHEVTISARSFDIELDAAVRLAEELLRGRGRDRAPLERLASLLSRLPFGDQGDRLPDAAESAGQGAHLLDAAAHEVARDLRAFREWCRESAGNMTREERAFLLHDYLECGRGDRLATHLKQFRDAVDQLDNALRVIIEELGTVPHRSASRLRWSLRRPLDLLGAWREGLDLWLGGKSGEADFSEDFHYEAIFEGRRRPLLCLKWLLPHKWLGEEYFPSLKSAALVSATARVRNGFRAMKGFLGLDILEQRTLESLGREVAEFAGPPTFDPRAALVCIPKDAPPYLPAGPGLDEWTRYVEEVLLFLAERTRGRTLALFTNRLTLQRAGERLGPPFAARGIPLLWQGMPGLEKEEIMEHFRQRVDSVLLGLDTFWYGVDFPGETCQYVVVTKLPYGPLDDYMFAQRARMGFGPHRSRIYLPRALAMFRQGCGRLLRNEDDRGVVFLLDRRVLEKRHANFLAELPRGLEDFEEPNLLVADSDACFRQAFAHMGLTAGLEERGLAAPFSEIRPRSPVDGIQS
ncbi:MAG: ATP-dependent DNA helicase [Planctomycetota bacterium]